MMLTKKEESDYELCFGGKDLLKMIADLLFKNREFICCRTMICHQNKNLKDIFDF